MSGEVRTTRPPGLAMIMLAYICSSCQFKDCLPETISLWRNIDQTNTTWRWLWFCYTQPCYMAWNEEDINPVSFQILWLFQTLVAFLNPLLQWWSAPLGTYNWVCNSVACGCRMKMKWLVRLSFKSKYSSIWLRQQCNTTSKVKPKKPPPKRLLFFYRKGDGNRILLSLYAKTHACEFYWFVNSENTHKQNSACKQKLHKIFKVVCLPCYFLSKSFKWHIVKKQYKNRLKIA